MPAADAPISASGWRTVVNGGPHQRTISMSSNPARLRSSGTRGRGGGLTRRRPGPAGRRHAGPRSADRRVAQLRPQCQAVVEVEGADVHQGGIDGLADGVHRGPGRLQPGLGAHVCQRPGGHRDPGVAQLERMPRRGDPAAPVGRADRARRVLRLAGRIRRVCRMHGDHHGRLAGQQRVDGAAAGPGGSFRSGKPTLRPRPRATPLDVAEDFDRQMALAASMCGKHSKFPCGGGCARAAATRPVPGCPRRCRTAVQHLRNGRRRDTGEARDGCRRYRASTRPRVDEAARRRSRASMPDPAKRLGKPEFRMPDTRRPDAGLLRPASLPGTS